MGETDHCPEIGEEIEVTVWRGDERTEAEIEIGVETEERIKEEIMKEKDLDPGQGQDLDTRRRVRKSPEDIPAAILLALTLTPLALMTPQSSSRNWSSRRWRRRRD